MKKKIEKFTVDEKVFLILKIQELLYSKFGKFNLPDATEVGKKVTELIESEYLSDHLNQQDNQKGKE